MPATGRKRETATENAAKLEPADGVVQTDCTGGVGCQGIGRESSDADQPLQVRNNLSVGVA